MATQTARQDRSPAAAPAFTATRADCVAMDARDPLAPMRDRFALPDARSISTAIRSACRPRDTAARIADTVTARMGRDLIRSWNSAGWIDVAAPPRQHARTADRRAPGEVVVTDSTSINLFKVLTVAMQIAARDATRDTIVSEADNFPTDLYIAEGVIAQRRGGALSLVSATRTTRAPNHRRDASATSTAVLMLTHVNYRTGAMHDMAALTQAAHEAGALVAVGPRAFGGRGAGRPARRRTPTSRSAAATSISTAGPARRRSCGSHPRHVDASATHIRQPLSGWLGHAAPFKLVPAYQPADGIGRFLCGTQPILSMSALECGSLVVFARRRATRLQAVRKKSLALTDCSSSCRGAFGRPLALVTPRDAARRGSQVSFIARAAPGTATR